MREISGALVVLAAAIVFAASVLAPAIRPSGHLDNLTYVGLLMAGLLALFGAVLILSGSPKGGGR